MVPRPWLSVPASPRAMARIPAPMPVTITALLSERAAGTTISVDPAATISPDRSAGEISLARVIAIEARHGDGEVCDLHHGWSFAGEAPWRGALSEPGASVAWWDCRCNA